MPAQFGLSLTDGSTTLTLKALNTGTGRAAKVTPVPVDPARVAEDRIIPLHPFDGGLGPDKIESPRTYTYANTAADTTNSGFITLSPLINSLTMTSTVAQAAGQVRKCVEYNSKLWVLDGRYVHSISTSYAVSTERDLGASVIGSDILVVSGNIIVCNGGTGFIQTYDGSSWSTSSDVYAQCMVISGDKIHRVRSTNATVDNAYSAMLLSTSSLVSSMRTAADWASPSPSAGYVVSDNTYQAHTAIDLGGVPGFIRADGLFTADTQSRFKNQTPQILQSPHANNGIGAFSAQGATWIPYSRGLLRVRPGESVTRGPEVVDLPNVGWLVRGGFEFNNAIWLLARNEQGGSQSLIKMVPNKLGIGENEYLYHQMTWQSTPNESRWIGLFTAPTNPTIAWGGGSATTSASYMKLGRGAGRDIDDSNYAYSGSLGLVTGQVRPSELDSMEAVLHEIRVETFLTGSSPVLSVFYNIDSTQGTLPNSSTVTDREAGTGGVTAGGFHWHTLYPAIGAKGSVFNFRFSITQSGSPTGATRSEIHRAVAVFKLVPRMTDLIEYKLDMTGLTARGTLPKPGASEVFRQLREWANEGTVLSYKGEDYERGRTIRVMVVGAEESEEEISPRVGAGGAAQRVPTIQLALKRLDYAGAYAE